MTKPTSIKVRGVSHTGRVDPATGKPFCVTARKRGWCHYCAQVEPETAAGKKQNPGPGENTNLLEIRGPRPNGEVPITPARKPDHGIGDPGWTERMERYLCRDLRRVELPDGSETWVQVPSAEEALEQLARWHPHYYETYMDSLDGESAAETAARRGVPVKRIYNERYRSQAKRAEILASTSQEVEVVS